VSKSMSKSRTTKHVVALWLTNPAIALSQPHPGAQQTTGGKWRSSPGSVKEKSPSPRYSFSHAFVSFGTTRRSQVGIPVSGFGVAVATGRM